MTTSSDSRIKPRSLWQDAARRFARNRLAVVALVVILLIVLVTLLAPVLAPYPYDKQDYKASAQTPSRQHLMGTDLLGRDVFSRVIYGGRISISLAVLVQLAAVSIGMPLGAWAGFKGGKTDQVVMRVVDFMMAIPSLLLALLLLVALGPGYSNVLFALIVVSWPLICRLVRAQVLSLRESEFVVAARASGASDRRIVMKHILPNTISVVIVAATLGLPATIFREAGLSFIGIGIVPPTPSWGQMVGENYMAIQSSWHMSVFPALVLGLAILAFTLVGDGLQDALSPRERR